MELKKLSTESLNIIKRLQNYLKQEKKGLIIAFDVFIFVVLVFLAYLFFLGVPMTQARNFYNQGYLYYTEGNYSKAKESLERSLNAFYTKEAQTLKNKLPN